MKCRNTSQQWPNEKARARAPVHRAVGGATVSSKDGSPPPSILLRLRFWIQPRELRAQTAVSLSAARVSASEYDG